MHTRLKGILIAAVMVVGIGGLVYIQKQAPAPTNGTATMTSAITMEEIATHNTRTSCWTLINGSAYDLTSWVPEHPGGEEAILGICGTDGSARFNGKHGGAAQQETILAGFKIGGSAAGVSAPPVVPAPVVEDDSGRGRGRGGDDND